MILTHPRLRVLASGLALMAMALGGALAGFAPAAADDAGDEGSGESGGLSEPEEQDLQITESALYAHPLTDALPPTLTDNVPPQLVCVVQPDLCPEELRPLTEAVGTVLDTVDEQAQVSPVQPVPPGSVAVAYFGGFQRYTSAVKFEVPDVPEGEEVTSFKVSLAQAQPSYDLNSPAFRDVIQAAMVSVGDQDPAVLAERLPDILSESEPLEFDSDAIGMEACPLTKPFEAGGAPQAQHSDEIPRKEGADGDGPDTAAADCVLGATGSFDEESERWEFDLAFAADAWASGDLENHGVLITPSGVGSLAYGDPDVTTNAQLTFDIEDATVAHATAEAPEPVGDFDTMEMGEEPMASEDLALEDGGGEFDGGADTGAGFDGGAADAPEVADGVTADGQEMASEPVDEPEVAVDQQLGQAAPAGAEPGPQWWVWLLVPAFAAGAYLVGNAMTASPLAAVAGAERPGALSRLIERRNGAGPTTT